MRTVELRLDEAAELAVWEAWRRLAAAAASQACHRSPTNCPHLTLAACPELTAPIGWELAEVAAGAGRNERRRRALSLWDEDMRNRHQHETDTGHQPSGGGMTGAQRRAEIRALADRLALAPLTAPKTHQILLTAAPAAGLTAVKVGAAWRAASGFAHGRYWPNLRASQPRAAIPGADGRPHRGSGHRRGTAPAAGRVLPHHAAPAAGALPRPRPGPLTASRHTPATHFAVLTRSAGPRREAWLVDACSSAARGPPRSPGLRALVLSVVGGSGPLSVDASPTVMSVACGEMAALYQPPGGRSFRCLCTLR